MGKVRKIRGSDGDNDTNGTAPQGAMFQSGPGEDDLRTERMFEVELTLSLKEEGGKADKIVLLCTKAKGTLVARCIDLALDSRRNQAIIGAILDNPSEQELAQAEARREQIQSEGEAALEA